MANQEPGIADVIKESLRDAQDLIRSEIALAKVEMREEATRLRRSMVLLAGAVFMGALMVVFLLTSIAWGLAAGFNWPVWIGFAVVTGGTLIVAVVLGLLGRNRLVANRHMPRTVDTMKENAKWMRARTS